MSFDIRDKTALVTGANRGIGRAIVDSCVQHGAAKVYAAVRKLESAAPLVTGHGDKVVPIRIDLAEPATIIAAADKHLFLCTGSCKVSYVYAISMFPKQRIQRPDKFSCRIEFRITNIYFIPAILIAVMKEREMPQMPSPFSGPAGPGIQSVTVPTTAKTGRSCSH